MARREYSDEIKAQVMAALLAGQSISATADKFKIPKGTVSGWARRAGQGINSELATVATQKRERIGHLIIDNLEAEMEATKAMTNVFKDEQWLRKQEASQLAVLYGVIKDKTHRVLEALPDDAGDMDRE
jgi:transposase-like protein